MAMRHDRFAVFILTFGRAGRVVTLKTLRKQQYSGPVYLVVSTDDPTVEEYRRRYGSEWVLVFDKAEIEKTFDTADNFPERRAVIYARNAAFGFARQLGLEAFLELYDDYERFRYSISPDGCHCSYTVIGNLDRLFDAFLDGLAMMPQRVLTVCMAQGGDYMGQRVGRPFRWETRLLRKAMNTFFLRVDRPFAFVGKVNEDVNTYVELGKRGYVFLTVPMVAIYQKATQANEGGMTGLYLDSGTYVKSSYTVMFNPSAVKIDFMGVLYQRIHHNISWDHAVPCIVPERFRVWA
jgi:hypothetical protein